MPVTRLALAGALLAAAASPLASQGSDLDTRFKFRVAGQAAGLQDKLDGRLLGMGFEVGYRNALGRFTAELGYFYKSGQAYRAEVGGMATVPGKTVDPRYSADVRKNGLDGTTLRLGFERNPGEELTYHAGLQLTFNRFRHQYMGTIADGYSDRNDPWNPRPSDAKPGTYLDTYNGVPIKGNLGFSPYAGIDYRLDESSSLEVNLLVLNYKSYDYVHVAGAQSTAQDRLDSRTRFAPHVEFAYVFRF